MCYYQKRCRKNLEFIDDDRVPLDLKLRSGFGETSGCLSSSCVWNFKEWNSLG